jgi:hypothetical protein
MCARACVHARMVDKPKKITQPGPELGSCVTEEKTAYVLLIFENFCPNLYLDFHFKASIQ